MDRPALGVRSDLADLAPYISPQLPAKVRLNTNESPYQPSREMLEEVEQGLRAEALNRYPERDALVLTDGLAARTGWSRDGIWIANGSNEVFLHLFLAFGGPERTCLTFEPTYSLHSNIARIAGTITASAPRARTWDIPDGTLEGALDEHRPDIVLFCSPNNPTGLLESRSAVEIALRRVPIVVVDEAYIEFARDGSSLSELLDDHPNLVIVNTFSKAWSLAGVRLGYLLADPAIVEELYRVRLPYHLSTFTQLVGNAALRHEDDGAQRIAEIVGERERITQGLSDRGFEPYPSEANFVLFEVGDRAQTIWKGLLERGVLVRNYPSSPVLGTTLRVTAGLADETDAFLEALDEVLER